eukprot:304023-Amphidinium_carterae.1
MLFENLVTSAIFLVALLRSSTAFTADAIQSGMIKLDVGNTVYGNAIVFVLRLARPPYKLQQQGAIAEAPARTTLGPCHQNLSTIQFNSTLDRDRGATCS